LQAPQLLCNFKEYGSFNNVVSSRNALFEAHFHLIRPIAAAIKRKLPPNFAIEDLEQLGALGLLAAASQCDPAKCFAAYAKARIRGAILDGIRRDIAAGVRSSDTGIEAVSTPQQQPGEISLRHAMQALTAKQRQALLLRLDGETRPSAGRKMGGITVSAVKDLERRAIANLRKRLAS
jgi:RNA polymerase sigma factor (sigma-70 family)